MTGACKGLSADGNSLSFSITSERDGCMAVLPVNPDEYSRIRVNGKETEGKAVFGVLTGIPIDSGTNYVEIGFLPKGTMAGAVISFLLLTALCVMHFLKIGKPRFIEITDRISLELVRVLWCSAVILIYIIPVAAFMIHQVIKRI